MYVSCHLRGGGGVSSGGGSTAIVSTDIQQQSNRSMSTSDGCTNNSDDPMAEYVSEEYHRVYIAVGSNMGNSYQNVRNAISMLEKTNNQHVAERSRTALPLPVVVAKDIDFEKANQPPPPPPPQHEARIKVIKTSFLRQTPPMYVTDQAPFLNGAMEIQTNLSPHALLTRLKQVEMSLGRDLGGVNSLRYGPRPIDLDIIQYGVVFREEEEEEEEAGKDMKSNVTRNGGIIVESPRLSIPHPRMTEREFVMSPLCDLNRNIIHPIQNKSSGEILKNLLPKETVVCDDDDDDDTKTNKETIEPPPEAVHILPLPRGRMLHFNETHIMGILNVTPDSFSDGGDYKGNVELAVEEALQMIEDGASIIDIGGESTRPGAKEVAVDIELERTIPVIRRIREGEISSQYCCQIFISTSIVWRFILPVLNWN